MAITQRDIDELNKAIASGVRSVTIGGESTIWNTTDSMIRARDDMVRQLAAQEAAATGTPRQKRSYLYLADRGY
jgi:hypothetical protein